jgi:hypothetical protein
MSPSCFFLSCRFLIVFMIRQDTTKLKHRNTPFKLLISLEYFGNNHYRLNNAVKSGTSHTLSINANHFALRSLRIFLRILSNPDYTLELRRESVTPLGITSTLKVKRESLVSLRESLRYLSIYTTIGCLTIGVHPANLGAKRPR